MTKLSDKVRELIKKADSSSDYYVGGMLESFELAPILADLEALETNFTDEIAQNRHWQAQYGKAQGRVEALETERDGLKADLEWRNSADAIRAAKIEAYEGALGIACQQGCDDETRADIQARIDALKAGGDK